MKDLLRALEERLLDERLVRRRVALAAEGGLTEVAAVAQDRQHGVLVEGPPLLGLVSALGEPVGEGCGALEALCIAAEDLARERCLRRVGTSRPLASSRR